MTAGKARYLGLSEWTVEQIQAAVGAEFFVSSQPQYSMLWQAPEAELFDACAPLGISHVVWSPLAQGVLTGKYRAGQQPPADSRAASTADAESSMRGLVMNDGTLEAVERLRPVAEHAGRSLSELALAWVLRAPTSRPRSPAPPAPNRFTPTPRHRASPSARTRSTLSTKRSPTRPSPSRRPHPARDPA